MVPNGKHLLVRHKCPKNLNILCTAVKNVDTLLHSKVYNFNGLKAERSGLGLAMIQGVIRGSEIFWGILK